MLEFILITVLDMHAGLVQGVLCEPWGLFKKTSQWHPLDTLAILLGNTVDGRNPASPGMYKPCKSWEKLPTSTGACSLPSTVAS